MHQTRSTRAAVHGAERGLTYLPIWRREAGSVRPGLGLVAVVCHPGVVVLRRGRSQRSLIRNQTSSPPPHTATASKKTLIVGGKGNRGGEAVGQVTHLGLEDVVEGRRHADGEAAAVVLRPRPRVRDAAQHRGPLFGGMRLRWRRLDLGLRSRCRGRRRGGGGNGDGGVDGEAAARGSAAEEFPPLVRVKRRRGEREESGGGHGVAPSGGDDVVWTLDSRGPWREGGARGDSG